jgi:hypothetical protein
MQKRMQILLDQSGTDWMIDVLDPWRIRLHSGTCTAAGSSHGGGTHHFLDRASVVFGRGLAVPGAFMGVPVTHRDFNQFALDDCPFPDERSEAI